LKYLKLGRSKLVVVASNCPKELMADIEHYAKLFGVGILRYSGNSVELGVAAGRPFSVSVLSIVEPGNSNILSAVT